MQHRDRLSRREKQELGAAIEAAILRELRRWDGSDPVPIVAEHMAPHQRRRVMTILNRTAPRSGGNPAITAR